MHIKDMNKSSINNSNIKERFFNMLINYFVKLSVIGRVIVIIIVFCISFTFARKDYLGKDAYKISHILIPFNLPFIDPALPDILLNFTFEVENEFGREKGKNGETYFSGNNIYLSINSNRKCWLCLFCIDAKGIYGLKNGSTEVFLFDPNDYPYQFEFLLDETIGSEIYLAVASHQKFDFGKDIKPKINNVFPELNSKGPVFFRQNLSFGDAFYQSIIHINHQEFNGLD